MHSGLYNYYYNASYPTPTSTITGSLGINYNTYSSATGVSVASCTSCTSTCHGSWKRSNGEEELLSKSYLEITPNPFSEELNINFTQDKKNSNFGYEIIDITGRLVLSGVLSQTHETIDTKSLSKGIYHIKVFNHETLVSSQKAVKY